jgi:hypothetical protein
MMVEIELWHLIALLLSFFGAVVGFWKFIEARREKSDDRRWEDLHRHLDARFLDISEAQRKEREEWIKLERGLMELKAELPRQYVLRDDYIRMQSIIEGKIDALALRIENAQLRGLAGNRGDSI